MFKIWISLLALVAAILLISGPVTAANKESAKTVPAEEQAAKADETVQAKPQKAAKAEPVPAKAPAAKEKKAEPAAKPKVKTSPNTKKAAKKDSKGNPLGLKGALSGSSQEPIKIISNRLVADDNDGTVTFTGKVKAVQGDTTLYCDQLTVFYAKIKVKGKSEQDAQRELTRIVTEGHVKVVLPGQIAYGQKGVYQIAESIIILKGRPKIVSGGNTLIGDKIIVYLNENKAVVEGGRQMVEAVIIPQSLEDNDQASADAGDTGSASGIGTVSAGTN